MNDYEPNPYDYHIAKAAREFINELIKQDRGESNSVYNKLNKLRWIILAEQNGWNPNIYFPNRGN